MKRFLQALVLTLLWIGTNFTVSASPHWVDRSLILPSHHWTLDVGYGYGYQHAPRYAGSALNLEANVGLNDEIQFGVRAGLYLTEDGRILQIHRYGRLFDTETYGTEQDTFTNPEFSIRSLLIDTQSFELGVEGRLMLPIEDNSRLGMVAALPMNLYLGQWGRLETGLYVPLFVFHNPVQTILSFPFRLWFYVNEELWVGPIGGVRLDDLGGDTQTEVIGGLGIGHQVNEWLDLKGQIVFPHINQTAGARDLGLGVGVQVRLE